MQAQLTDSPRASTTSQARQVIGAPTGRAARRAPGCTPACRAVGVAREGGDAPHLLRQSTSCASVAVASVVSADSLSRRRPHRGGIGGRRRGRLLLRAEALTQSSSCRASSRSCKVSSRGTRLDAVAAGALLVALAGLTLVRDAPVLAGTPSCSCSSRGWGALCPRCTRCRRGSRPSRGTAGTCAPRRTLGVTVVLAVLVGLARRVVGFAS